MCGVVLWYVQCIQRLSCVQCTLWCVLYSARHGVQYTLWCVVCSILYRWYVEQPLWYVVYSLMCWTAVCGMQYTLWCVEQTLWCVICGILCDVLNRHCGVWYAVYSVMCWTLWCVVCVILCMCWTDTVVCGTQYTLWCVEHCGVWYVLYSVCV